jgi:transcriptional regulator with XRE-family HTH domain
MSLGSKLHALRAKRRNSLQEVADAVGVSKTHIWDMEKGNSANPSMELLRKLADHFQVTVEYLVEPEPSTNESSAEAKAFFRSFQKLSEQDRQIIRQTMERLKVPKAKS